jgi:hypothetical protein
MSLTWRTAYARPYSAGIAVLERRVAELSRRLVAGEVVVVGRCRLTAPGVSA